MKSQYKASLKSEKIFHLGFKVRRLNLGLADYLKGLNKEDWITFEEKECRFRKSIAGKKINYGDFCCKGNINLLEKVIKSLSNIFLQAQNSPFFQEEN